LFYFVVLDSGDFLPVDFPECVVDSRFEFLPCRKAASSLLNGGLDSFPGCSAASAVGVMDFSTLVLEPMCLAIELQFALHEEGSELGAVPIVPFGVFYFWLASPISPPSLRDEFL